MFRPKITTRRAFLFPWAPVPWTRILQPRQCPFSHFASVLSAGSPKNDNTFRPWIWIGDSQCLIHSYCLGIWYWKMTLASGDLDSTVTSELSPIPRLIGHQDLLYAGTPQHLIDKEHLAEKGIVFFFKKASKGNISTIMWNYINLDNFTNKAFMVMHVP